MDAPNKHPVPIPLDAGIDITVSEQAAPNGLSLLENWLFDAKGDVVPRQPFVRQTSTATTDTDPGILLPVSNTVPVHKSAGELPLETTVKARAGSGARVIAVQSAYSLGYTFVALTVRNEEPSTTSTTVPNAYIQAFLLDADYNVVLSKKLTPARVADVKVTATAAVSGNPTWFLSYVDPVALELYTSLATYDLGGSGLTVNLFTLRFSSVDVEWKSSVHIVESVSFGWVLFVWSSGTLRYQIFTVVGAPSGGSVNTTFASSAYHEMCSVRFDGFIWIVSGHATSTSLGIYVTSDSAISVSRYAQPIGATPDKRAAVIPTDGAARAAVFYELPSNIGLGSFTINSGGAVTADVTVLGVALADAGGALFEQTVTGATRRTGLIGFTSAEAVVTNVRSHVLVRVVYSGVLTLSTAAILAHSDAGVFDPRRFVDAGSNVDKTGGLARYSTINDTNLELPVLYVTRTTADPSVPQGSDAWDLLDRAVRLTRVSSAAREHHGIVKLGPNTYVGGTIPLSWDGRFVTPAGFPIPPHSALVVDGGATVGALPEGEYSYYVRASYQDFAGTIFDSPSIIDPLGNSQVTVASGDTPEVTIYPSTMWTEMDRGNLDAPRFRTEVFRNANPLSSGDLTWRKAFTHTHYAATTTPVTFDDVRAANFVGLGELLSTSLTGPITPGVLPALSHIWSHRSRIWGVDAYDPELVRFTTEYVAPTAPYWNDVLAIRVTNSGGPVIGGASLGDKCIAFQENQICVLAGEGPDGTGAGTFTYPEALRGVGARIGSQGAIVEVPSGVMFVHSTGIYHLGMDLALTFVGERLLPRLNIDTQGLLAPIHRAVYLHGRGQVWFLTNGGASGRLGNQDVLVYDTIRQTWTALSSSLGPFSDVIETPEGVYLADMQGRLLEALGASSDVPGLNDLDEDGVQYPITLRAKTQKLRVDNAHQLRVRKLHVTGSSDSVEADIQVVITTYNDSRGAGNEDSSVTHTFSLSDQGLYWQVPIRAQTQRCHFFEVDVTVENVESADNSLRLSSLLAEVSAIPGTGKVPASKRPGTNV